MARTDSFDPAQARRNEDEPPTTVMVIPMPMASIDTAMLEIVEAGDGRYLITLAGISRFRVAESPMLAPELAAEFPEIKTYAGQGIDDPSATTRFGWTAKRPS